MYSTVEDDAILLTFNCNTDGAPLSKSGKISMWPMQIIINELPPKLRFNKTILAAIWSSKKEPSPSFMNLCIESFNMQMKKLMTEGMFINIDSGKQIRFVLRALCACVDSVARPVMKNTIQFNGYKGCSWCYAHGEYADKAMRAILL